MRDGLLRLSNGLRKIAAGLRPFSESVWPGVRNDLFVAHESIYHCFGQFVHGKCVLDAGCGTGYGCRILAEAGARSVIGVDIDRFNIRFAVRHYADAHVRFVQDNIETLGCLSSDSVEVVVASNSLEHLHDLQAFVATLKRVLGRSGCALVAVPPIVSVADRDVHSAIRYHRSNLTITEWHDLFLENGFDVQCYSHRAKAAAMPHFGARDASRLSVSDFEFTPATLEQLVGAPSITAIFELRRRPHDALTNVR